jgi:hypothetical protein
MHGYIVGYLSKTAAVEDSLILTGTGLGLGYGLGSAYYSGETAAKLKQKHTEPGWHTQHPLLSSAGIGTGMGLTAAAGASAVGSAVSGKPGQAAVGTVGFLASAAFTLAMLRQRAVEHLMTQHVLKTDAARSPEET